LWTKTGEPPPELLRYRLRQMYQCTPSELAQQTGEHLWEMYHDLMCASVEAQVQRQRANG